MLVLIPLVGDALRPCAQAGERAYVAVLQDYHAHVFDGEDRGVLEGIKAYGDTAAEPHDDSRHPVVRGDMGYPLLPEEFPSVIESVRPDGPGDGAVRMETERPAHGPEINAEPARELLHEDVAGFDVLAHTYNSSGVSAQTSPLKTVQTGLKVEASTRTILR